MVCKRAQYIYTRIYIRIVRDVYVSRSRSWKIMVNGPTGGRRSNDTASSINFHLFFRLVNLNTVTKIRLDIYADISRPVYIRSPLERIARILKKKENRTNFVFRPSDHEFHIRYRLLLCYAYDFRCFAEKWFCSQEADRYRRRDRGIEGVIETITLYRRMEPNGDRIRVAIIRWREN